MRIAGGLQFHMTPFFRTRKTPLCSTGWYHGCGKSLVGWIRISALPLPLPPTMLQSKKCIQDCILVCVIVYFQPAGNSQNYPKLPSLTRLFQKSDCFIIKNIKLQVNSYVSLFLFQFSPNLFLYVSIRLIKLFGVLLYYWYSWKESILK